MAFWRTGAKGSLSLSFSFLSFSLSHVFSDMVIGIWGSGAEEWNGEGDRWARAPTRPLGHTGDTQAHTHTRKTLHGAAGWGLGTARESLV